MKILVDALSAREGGGVTYVRQLLPILARISPADRYYVLLAPMYQRDLIDALAAHVRVIPAPLPGTGVLRRLWFEETTMQHLLRSERFDLLFTPTESGATRAPCPRVVLAGNLSVFASPFAFPPGGARRRAIIYRATRQPIASRSLRTADRVVCVSATFRDKVVRRLRLDPKTTSVVHHGVDPLFFASPDPARAGALPGIPPSYLLAVSSLAPHKNFPVLLKAYTAVYARLGHDTPALVVAGGVTDQALYRELLAQVAASSLEERVHFIGRVDQNDLPALYRAATLSLFPSRLESFGLPVLESMAAGTPAIVSDLPICREIGGDAPRFVAVGDSTALAAAIVELLGSPERRAAMADRGRRRAAGFSWEATARAMADIFSDVAGDRPDRPQLT
ncbi:MAG: glycosyltransferase family 4 protein [Gemmatimonadota bacterium]|nr:glycosyltransferase family 4 protein [Gemmatimonadota bacterium]